MSRRDDSVPMRHMLDHAREALAMVGERSRQDLDADRMLQLSLTHLVRSSERPASRVSREGRGRHPYIPWQDAINTRNRFIHGYDSVDYDIVWQIATRELPVLIAALERALPGHAS